ncbi:DUF6221 family protein [Streptomyces sp. NBC_00572]|uniref:DUF6221 family protein n=1 Tax=Streptomyces sp. NBC_00572 TaxID=2903664 RepID=UPI002257A367|nr:DUF6221 family protein [Streptomyces sp. NBC_00572]MCX4984701.1 DUF6221 family protein [Streptomyces sp. NBC_00572]
MAASNRYGALCAAELCATYVPPGGGILVRGESGWLTYCPDDDPALGPRRFSANPDERDHEPMIAFLLARLDEEEATAGAAGITHWRHWPARSQRVVDDHDELVVVCPLRDVADQIATWGPMSAVANIEARRMVLDLYEQAALGPARDALRQAVQALAMTYRDHVDYDISWTLRQQL